MSTKRKRKICIEKDQQTSDDGDKDQLAKSSMLLPIPETIDKKEACVKRKKRKSHLAWCDITKYKCKSSIESSYGTYLLTQSDYEKILLRYGNSIKELSLSNNCDLSILPFVSDLCKNLTSLECEFNVDSLNNNADHFIQAITQLDKLKCIKIIISRGKDTKINLFEIINSLPEELNEIHIHNKGFMWRPIFWTLEKFKNLEKISLSGIHFDELTLQEIAEATTLVHLDIEFSSDLIGFPLFKKLVNLEYIQIMTKVNLDSECENTKEEATKVLNTIFRKCKNLKHLHISNYLYDLNEISLDKWKNFTNLEYLTLRCDEVSLDLANTIVEYCKNLKHLYMKLLYSYFINAYVVKKLTKLKNLESLVIDSKHLKLSEKSIIAISKNCKKLKRLDLEDCIVKPSCIDDDDSSPSIFNKLFKLQYIEHLNLSNISPNIDDSTIIAIADNCKNLKSLKIKYDFGSNITETALVAVTKLENLQKLHVGGLDISDSFIIKLKGLKKFDCFFCEKLTDAGIIQLIKNNPDLEKINVQGIDNITIDMVIGADQATKNRTNGIVLHIITNNLSILEASKSIIKSKWLVVKRFKNL